ncbi:hypothetical protein Lal_00034868 [Lupinus albus]|nr:hypothetical protein Lal_00034868 [Lupinus albus]
MSLILVSLTINILEESKLFMNDVTHQNDDNDPLKNEAKLEESKWDKARYEKLNMTEEKRLKTICHSQLYQGRLTRAFDTKVCPERFEVGNLVMEKFLPNQEDANGKWPQTIKVPTSSRMYSHEGPRPCKT